MEHFGRPSAASLSVVTAEGLSAVQRPSPPAELSDEQAHEWRSVVNRLPAEWFPRETHGILAQYCRHVVTAKRIATLISDFEKSEEFSIDGYNKLLIMQEREGRAISSLATRMRISQQSTLDREKRKPNKPMRKPWDDEGR